MKKYQFSIAAICAGLLLVTACKSVNNTVSKQSETTVPATQMAIVQNGNGGADILKLQKIPVLVPGANEVLIKVVAAGINPIERRFREGGGGRPAGGMGAPGDGMGPPPGGGMGGGMGRAPGGAGGPSVPGGDLSGIIVQIGDSVTNVKVGDAVFAKIPFGAGGLNGAYSQYAVTTDDQVAPKPSDQTFAEAAGIATVAMTAMRTLDHAAVKAGDRVFINGIGGGIGSSAAQIAMARGAYALGTASVKHHDYLATIGIAEVINYREVLFDEVITELVDIAIETVGTQTANQALNIIKPGGQLVSIAGPASQKLCDEKQVTCARIGGNVGRTNKELLTEISQLAEQGKFRLNVDTIFPLAEAGAAQDQNYNVGTTGKVILIVDEALADTK